MAKNREIKTEKVELKMYELRELKLWCDAITACNPWSDSILHLAIRSSIGSRALKIMDESIGAGLELIKDQMETLVERHGTKRDDMFNDPEYRSANKEENALWKKTATFEYDPIEISLIGSDGEDIAKRFPDQKIMTWRGQQYTIQPYGCLMDMIDRGFFIVKQ